MLISIDLLNILFQLQVIVYTSSSFRPCNFAPRDASDHPAQLSAEFPPTSVTDLFFYPVRRRSKGVQVVITARALKCAEAWACYSSRELFSFFGGNMKHVQSSFDFFTTPRLHCFCVLGSWRIKRRKLSDHIQVKREKNPLRKKKNKLHFL